MGSGGGGGALGKETAASSHVLAALAKSRGQSEPSVHWPWPQALPRLAQRFALLACSEGEQERRSAAKEKRRRADEPASSGGRQQSSACFRLLEALGSPGSRWWLQCGAEPHPL